MTANFGRVSGFLRAFAWILVLSLSTTGLSWAQEATQDGAQAEYRLGSGDQLRITFFGKHTVDLSGEYEIDGAGLVSLPLVGSLKIGGLTVSDAEKKIVNAYKPDYVLNPRVSVQVMNYRPFYITGQVEEPGSYP